ncbi:MAG: LytTR family DNA-binding domain-containing protein [Clostridia bacterium]|nr:LytTR family DNA-binding domain-containing protein [Clostridia bacterium]
MKIALCDDESGENRKMSILINEYAFSRNIEISCSVFLSGEQLLQAERFDFYFLDYKMNGMNGIETACALREKFGNRVTLCFLTSYETAASRAINSGIYADGFLNKPVDRTRLFEMLDRLLADIRYNIITVKNAAGFEILYPKNILYAEAMVKNTVIHCLDGDRKYSCLLKEFEKNYLSGDVFFRVHRSYTVNMMNVISCNSRYVTLKDGTQLPLKKGKEFLKAFEAFNFKINTNYC